MRIADSCAEHERFKDELTDYVDELRVRAGDNMLSEFSALRKFSKEIIDRQKIFYIGDSVELLLPTYLNRLEDFGVISKTNGKPIFHNRYVIPIMDVNGKVMNLVGYNKDADERYLYGTAKYYERRDTLFGLENLHEAYRCGYGILTEGITDTIMLRNVGYPMSFANCGTHEQDVGIRQLNRCRHGVIEFPDRDEAGLKARLKWEVKRGVVINTFITFKDVDEMCRASSDNIEVVKQCLDEAISYITSREHGSRKIGIEKEYTIMQGYGEA